MPLDSSTHNDALVLRILFEEAPDGWDSSADIDDLGTHLAHLSFAEKVGHLSRNLVNAVLDGHPNDGERFYLVTTDPGGRVSACEVTAVAASLAAVGDTAIERQGDDAVSICESARDALARVMPDQEDCPR